MERIGYSVLDYSEILRQEGFGQIEKRIQANQANPHEHKLGELFSSLKSTEFRGRFDRSHEIFLTLLNMMGKTREEIDEIIKNIKLEEII